MQPESLIGTLIAIITLITTYKGLRAREFQEQYLFNVDNILANKQYYRLVSSGFLHANWFHFAFNMIALVSFSYVIEKDLGIISLLIIYFTSLIGGNLLSLLIHKNHGDYTAVGASGAISGLIAGSILLDPLGKIGIPGIELWIQSWIVGLLFVLISILGIKSQSDNIGHEAHLGGLIIGIITTSFIEPGILLKNWWVAILLVTPVIIFFGIVYRNPQILLTNKWDVSLSKKPKKSTPQKSLDELLDKISKSGVDSLTKKEKDLLNKYKDQI